MAQNNMLPQPIENPLAGFRLRNVFGNPPGALPDNDIGQGPSARVQENPIFGQDQQVFGQGRMGNTPAMSAQEEQDPDGVRERSHAILDKFLESINQMPERENYKRGKWGNIATGLIGAFQGAQAGREFNEAPYSNAVRDWKLKNDALASAAGQERMANSADDMYGIRAGELERKTREGEARIKIAETNAESSRIRAEAMSELNNGGTVREDKVTGKTYLVTRTGMVKELPINTLTEAERQQLITQGRLEVVEAQGKNAMAVAAVPRTVNTNSTTTTNDPNAQSPGTLKPGDKAMEEYNNAQRVYNTYPEYQEFITLGEPGTNKFAINVPEGSLKDEKTGEDLSDSLRERILGLIYNRSGDINLDGPQPKTTTTNRSSVSTRGNTPPATPNPPTRFPGRRPNSDITPPTVTPPASRFGGPPPTASPFRQQAIDILTKAGKPTTEANVAEVIRQLSGGK